MAEQYAPIAKDESFNTTDLTPKNIADVLKDGLKNIADSVKPTADEIPFDNTGTSLVSTDVEGAIKELDGFVRSANTITNLSSFTGKTLVEAVLANGRLIEIFSTTGGNRLSDLPIFQAGRYVVYTSTYYKQIEFWGTNGTMYLFNYDNNTWYAIKA